VDPVPASGTRHGRDDDEHGDDEHGVA
jgi:hypothetical protein